MNVRWVVFFVWIASVAAPALCGCSAHFLQTHLFERTSGNWTIHSSLYSPLLCSESEKQGEEYDVHVERRQKEPIEAARDLKKRITDEIERRIKAGRKTRTESDKIREEAERGA